LEHKEELRKDGIKSINSLAAKMIEVSLEALTERYKIVREAAVNTFQSRRRL